MSTENQVNNARIAFSRTLARALNNPDIRAFVRDKMFQADNSDYEMVYIAEKNTLINGQTFANALKSYAEPQVIAQFGENFFEEVVNISPLLTICMSDVGGAEANDWYLQYVPAVAANMDGDSIHPLFSTNQNVVVTFSLISQSPSVPTLYVADAQAHYLVKANGITNWGTHISDHMPKMYKFGPDGPENDVCDDIYLQALINLTQHDITGEPYYLLAHNALMELYYACIGIDPNGGGGDPPTCTEPCERDCETADEMLIDFRINGWGVFTNIRNQLFERRYIFHGEVLLFRVTTTGGLSQIIGLKYISPALKKGDLLDCSPSPCVGKWVTAGLPYRIWTDWNLSEIASPYVIHWSEVDNVQTSATIGFPMSASFKFEDVGVSMGVNASMTIVGEKTVLLGSAPVFYCDPIMAINNTGSVQFRCN